MMKDKERDIFDDLFRSKLQDFEVDVKKDDWERILNRLSTQTFVPFRKRICTAMVAKRCKLVSKQNNMTFIGHYLL